MSRKSKRAAQKIKRLPRDAVYAKVGDIPMQVPRATRGGGCPTLSGRAVNGCLQGLQTQMPSSRVLTFTDPHEYQAAIRGMEAEVLPTTRGGFRAELTHINFDRLSAQAGSESLPRITRGPIKKDRVAISFSRRNRLGSSINGMDISPGMLVIHSATELHNLTLQPYRWGAMSLAPADFAVAGRAIAGRELVRPSVAHTVRPSSALWGHLLNLHDNATRLARTAPDTLACPEVARSLEDALIHAMIRCLTESSVVERPLNALSHMHIISRLEEFVATNSDRPIHLGELCAATGVSESTLRRCCHEYLGMGPNRYLWLRRMHLTRWALLRADPARATVTAIATDQGFWELGRFSVDYRSLFDESPSATLQRPLPDRLTKNRPLDLPVTDFA
jgi:AraC-like DNA-binding protein